MQPTPSPASAPLRLLPRVAVLGPLACLAATAGLPAQTTLGGQLVPLASYGVFAQEGTQVDLKALPLATPLPQGSTSLSASTSNASAATLIGWRVANGSLSCDVSEQGTGTGAVKGGTTLSTSTSNPQAGPHFLQLTITGAPGLRGKLQVWASGIARPGVVVNMSTDIHGDGSHEFALLVHSGLQLFRRRQWDLKLDASGKLVVNVATEARLDQTAGSTVWKTGISVVFTPGRFCDLADHGVPCPAQLTAADDVQGGDRVLTLTLDGASPQAPAALIFGTQQLGIPIPGTACRLLTDPAIVLPFATDQYGRAQLVFRTPLGPVIQAHAQEFVITPSLSLTGSDGLSIQCL